MPGKKEDKTTFVSEQWGLQLEGPGIYRRFIYERKIL